MKLLLLSGGVDSAALAYWIKPDIALTIDYGQVVARSEIDAARSICFELGIQHLDIRIDCGRIAKGSLGAREASVMSSQPEWWPFRNQLLITFAAAYFIDESSLEIVIGTVRGDGTAHKDGTKRFLRSINTLLRCQEGNARVTAPAIDLTSSELLKSSELPESILGWTFSCNRSLMPCGGCRSCVKRGQVLRESSSQLL